MTEERQGVDKTSNLLTTKRGFPVYRTNPSVPQASGLPTRTRRINVPGGKGAVIVDHSTGELKGLGGMGFWWADTLRDLLQGLYDDAAHMQPDIYRDGRRDALVHMAGMLGLTLRTVDTVRTLEGGKRE